MSRTAGWLVKALLVLLFIAWQFLVHANMGGGDVALLRYVLLALPLAGFALWIAHQPRNRALWFAALATAVVAVIALEHVAQLGVAVAYGLPHALIYLMLTFVFGHTLLPDKEPLITRLARRVHGVLPPGMEHHTRNVTVAWTVFCVAQLLCSGLLLVFASIELWSMFINLLHAPLLLLMFAGEHVIRMVCHPDFPRPSIVQAMRAFMDDSSTHPGSRAR